MQGIGGLCKSCYDTGIVRDVRVTVKPTMNRSRRSIPNRRPGPAAWAWLLAFLPGLCLGNPISAAPSQHDSPGRNTTGVAWRVDTHESNWLLAGSAPRCDQACEFDHWQPVPHRLLADHSDAIAIPRLIPALSVRHFISHRRPLIRIACDDGSVLFLRAPPAA